MIVFGADQERYGRLVESATLSVPLLDTVECRFSCQVEHEQDRYCIVADQWQHVYELSLAAQIPY